MNIEDIPGQSVVSIRQPKSRTSLWEVHHLYQSSDLYSACQNEPEKGLSLCWCWKPQQWI